MPHLPIILAVMRPPELDELLARLDETGEAGRAAREYLVRRRVRVRLRRQSTGARWTPFGNIELSPNQLGNEAYALSLIVHEACHLKQGIQNALSVRGELEAWQAQFAFLKSLTGKYSISSKYEALIGELMSLSVEDRADLKRARVLMRQFAGRKYRIHWLPLFPLSMEIQFVLRGK